MESTTKKTIQVSRGHTYTYYVSPAKDNKPTVLLQHGFPDDAHEWADLIKNHLVPAGYGVVAPDLLGYSGTSKPIDPAEFKFKLMVKDITDILDAEKIAQVVSLGHDWGSAMAQAVYNLAPSRVLGLVCVNVPYRGPTDAKFDLDGVLKATESIFGYGLFWYWKLFTAPDGPKFLHEHLPRLFDILHSTPEVWRKTVCTDGGLRKALEENDEVPVQPYVTDEMRTRWVERMSRDGLESPLNWYKGNVYGHQDGQLDTGNPVVNVPTLYLAYKDDVICRPENIQPAIQGGLLPHLTIIEHSGTHWALLNKPQEFGKNVVDWLEKNYGGAKH